MKKSGRKLPVYCFFTEEGENLQEMLLQSLQIFIDKNLRNYAVFDVKSGKKYNIYGEWRIASGGITCT